MDNLLIFLSVFLVLALVAISILALGLVDATKRIETLSSNNDRLFDQNWKLRDEAHGRKRYGERLKEQVADLTGQRDDLQKELDDVHSMHEDYVRRHHAREKIRAALGGAPPSDPTVLRQERAAAITEAREERQRSQELRVLLTAVLGDEGYASLSARQIRRAERKHKLRYQKDGNTGAVTLRAVPIAATENVGKFL